MIYFKRERLIWVHSLGGLGHERRVLLPLGLWWGRASWWTHKVQETVHLTSIQTQRRNQSPTVTLEQNFPIELSPSPRPSLSTVPGRGLCRTCHIKIIVDANKLKGLKKLYLGNSNYKVDRLAVLLLDKIYFRPKRILQINKDTVIIKVQSFRKIWIYRHLVREKYVQNTCNRKWQNCGQKQLLETSLPHH